MAFTLFGFQDFFREGIKSNIEVGTKKEQNTYSTQTTYSPTINRSYDVQYNIASGGSAIETKKESAVSQTPTTSPALTVIPIQSGSASTSPATSNEGVLSGITDNLTGILVIGGIGFIAYKMLKENNKQSSKVLKVYSKK